jgi:RNA polymerase sigma-70 factor (ECF subfamily)
VTEFEKIYRTYFNDVFLYIKKLSKDDSVAEEITSVAFFKAMRNIDSFKGNCDVRVWLCQIAKNSYYTYLKKHSRHADLESLENLDLAESSDNVAQDIINQDEAMSIHFLLHDLSEPYKEVFTLRIFGELSFKKIGKIFGKTENWACVTYHRAKSKIKEQIKGANYEK